MRRIVSDLHQTDGPSACVFFRFRFAYSLQTGLTQAKGGYITTKYFHSITRNLLRLDIKPLSRSVIAKLHRCLKTKETDASCADDSSTQELHRAAKPTWRSVVQEKMVRF
jgi:hypothetical protein